MTRAFIVLSTLLLLTIGGDFASAQSRGQGPSIGRVKISSGPVVIVRDAARLAATPGLKLYENDTILTDKGGAVGMTFSDNSRITMGSDSELIIVSYAFEQPGRTDEFEAKITRGTMTAQSGEIADRRELGMRVQMPDEVLGVRGTRFAISIVPSKADG